MTARGGRDGACGALALTAAVVASIAVAFLVGGESNRRSPLDARRPCRGGAGHRRDRGRTRRPAQRNADARSEAGAESSDAETQRNRR